MHPSLIQLLVLATTSVVQPLPLLLSPLVQIITLEITGLSAFYIYRQKITAYKYTKGLLLAVYVLFAGVIVFEFLRTAVYSTVDFTSSGFAYVYTIGGTSLILALSSCLTLPGGHRLPRSRRASAARA